MRLGRFAICGMTTLKSHVLTPLQTIVNYDELIEKSNTILDGVSRLKQEWERSKETIESVNQMRIVADGYIQSLQEANQSLGQCVEGLIHEVDRIQAVNDEILRTAEAMAKIGKGLG